MPMASGVGGISNYVNPLIQHYLRIAPGTISTTLHWRIHGEITAAAYAALRDSGMPDYPRVRHAATRLPDRIIAAAWELPFPGFASLTLPGTDAYLATTPMLPRHARCRRLTIIHDVTPAMIPEFFAEPRERYARRIRSHCMACDHIVCVSATTSTNLTAVCGIPQSKISVICPGPAQPVFPVEGDESVLSRLGIRGRFALYLGAFARNKNIDGLLRAFAHFRKVSRDRDWQLVIAGRDFLGPGALLNMIRELDLMDSVVVAGWLTDERWSLLRAAEILLHMSWYEGFPVPLTEAFAVGLPALVSNRGPFPEILTNPEQLVDPSDPVAVGDRLAIFAECADVRKEWREYMVRRARDFSWNTSAELFREVLMDLDY